jgi:hypothetical protein
MNWRRVLVTVTVLAGCAVSMAGCSFPTGSDAINERLTSSCKLWTLDCGEQSVVSYDHGGGSLSVQSGSSGR